MDSISLVTPPLDESTELLGKFDQFAPIAVAFWAKPGDGSDWVLYLSSPRLDSSSFHLAYRELVKILREPGFKEINALRIRLLEISDPRVEAINESYKHRPPHLPLHLSVHGFGTEHATEVYALRGTSGEFQMPSGRDTLHHIIDAEADHFQRNGTPPRKMYLPVLMAYELAKCSREDIGDISARIFKDGVVVLENEGFHGMEVEIVRDRNAQLRFE